MSYWLQNNHIDISDKTVEKGSIKTVDYRKVTDELISSIASDEKIQYIQVSKELPDEAYQVIDSFLEAKPELVYRSHKKQCDIDKAQQIGNKGKFAHIPVACFVKGEYTAVEYTDNTQQNIEYR